MKRLISGLLLACICSTPLEAQTITAYITAGSTTRLVREVVAVQLNKGVLAEVDAAVGQAALDKCLIPTPETPSPSGFICEPARAGAISADAQNRLHAALLAVYTGLMNLEEAFTKYGLLLAQASTP